MIDFPSLGASFVTVRQMCLLAEIHHERYRSVILGKEVIVYPGDDPHVVYRREFPELLDTKVSER